jgi:hypothetical protein
MALKFMRTFFQKRPVLLAFFLAITLIIVVTVFANRSLRPSRFSASLGAPSATAYRLMPGETVNLRQWKSHWRWSHVRIKKSSFISVSAGFDSLVNVRVLSSSQSKASYPVSFSLRVSAAPRRREERVHLLDIEFPGRLERDVISLRS